VWVSGPLPGAAHDLTAARISGIIRELAASGLVVLGDKDCLGEDDIHPSGTRARPQEARWAITAANQPAAAAFRARLTQPCRGALCVALGDAHPRALAILQGKSPRVLSTDHRPPFPQAGITELTMIIRWWMGVERESITP
jgi:hypothetical protein